MREREREKERHARNGNCIRATQNRARLDLRLRHIRGSFYRKIDRLCSIIDTKVTRNASETCP